MTAAAEKDPNGPEKDPGPADDATTEEMRLRGEAQLQQTADTAEAEAPAT